MQCCQCFYCSGLLTLLPFITKLVTASGKQGDILVNLCTAVSKHTCAHTGYRGVELQQQQKQSSLHK